MTAHIYTVELHCPCAKAITKKTFPKCTPRSTISASYGWTSLIGNLDCPGRPAVKCIVREVQMCKNVRKRCNKSIVLTVSRIRTKWIIPTPARWPLPKGFQITEIQVYMHRAISRCLTGVSGFNVIPTTYWNLKYLDWTCTWMMHAFVISHHMKIHVLPPYMCISQTRTICEYKWQQQNNRHVHSFQKLLWLFATEFEEKRLLISWSYGLHVAEYNLL